MYNLQLRNLLTEESVLQVIWKYMKINTSTFLKIRRTENKTRYSEQVVFCPQVEIFELCIKKAHFKNFAKFTGKDLRRSLFVNKVAGLVIYT